MANKEILKGEMMNEEQLGKVVGGTRGELSCDTKFLYALGFMSRCYEPGYCEAHPETVEYEINAALSKVGRREGEKAVAAVHGFKVRANINGKNEYSSLDSRFSDRAMFYKMVCDAAGQPDFDYSRFI